LPGRSEPLILAKEMTAAAERFSHLSSGLNEVLGNLSRIVRTAAEQLDAIKAAVDLKKSELKRLHDIDAAAVKLEQLLEDHRKQKESFEAQMRNESRAWEEEKARQLEEEKAYEETLKLQRQREEEEYKRAWEVEKARAQQQIEEEFRLIQQKNRLKQEAMERDYMQRELILKEKELEWVQLIQELEQFMSKLTRRAQSRAAVPMSPPQAEGLQETVRSGEEQGSGEPSTHQAEESQPSLSSLKEMLVSQGRRIENLNTEVGKEPPPFRQSEE
jgi:hypothetical protein